MALTDLTRISTSGIATGSTIDAAILRKDVSFRGTQVGVTSVLFDSSEKELHFEDNAKLKIGTHGDIQIYNDGTKSVIENGGNSLGGNNNSLHIYSQNDILHNSTYSQYFNCGAVNKNANSPRQLALIRNEGVKAYYNDNLKFETTNHGATVTGILTATGFSGPLSNASGISTFYDLRVTNNLTVEGSTTTLDTNLIGVDRVEVGANSNSVVGVAITQSGSADLVNLFDGATKVVTVDDVGNVGLASAIPSKKLDVVGDTLIQGQLTVARSTHPQLIIKDSDTTGASDQNGISFVDASNTQYGFIGQSGSSHTMLINNTNTINPIRLQINNSTKLEIGHTGVYVDNANFFVNSGNNAYFSGTIDINSNAPTLNFNDANGEPDYRIFVNAGVFSIKDVDSDVDRIRIGSDGKVGINTTDTTHLVTVSALAANTVIARFKALNQMSNFDIATDASSHGQAYVRNNVGAVKVQLNSNGVSYFTGGNVLIGTSAWSYEKPLNVQGESGSILSLYNGDTTSYAANTYSAIELKLLTGNTGNTFGALEIRGIKEEGTNGNNARALTFYTGVNGGTNQERLRIGSDGLTTLKGNMLINNPSGVSLLQLNDNTNNSLHEFGTPGNGDLRITVDKNDAGSGQEFQLYMRGNDAADLAFHIDHDRHVTIPNGNISVTGSGSFTKTSNNFVLVGSSNAAGAAIVLDGDSNGDGTGADYAYIEHDTSGDLNIVVDNPANAGNIKFFTNTSSERLRIESDGDINIGTATDPGNTLRYVDIGNYNTGGAAGSALRLITRESDGTDSASADIVKYKTGGLVINNNEKIGTAGYISFGVAANGGSIAERLRIAHGLVSTNTTFVANKITNSSSYTSHNANFYGGDVNSGGVRIELAHSTTTVSGNTASGAFPHNLLLSNYSGSGSADNRMVSIGFDVPTTSSHANATIAYQATGSGGVGDLQFWLENGNTSYERLRIKGDGNVGINETAPSEKLQIDGDILLGGQANASESNYAIKFEYNNHQFAKIVGDGRDQSGYGDIDFYTSPTNGAANLTQRMSIRADGKIGIGNFLSDNPATALHIDYDSNNLLTLDNSTAGTQKMFFAQNGGTHAQIYATSASGALTLESDPSNNHNNSYMNFRVDNSDRLHISDNGQFYFTGTDSEENDAASTIYITDTASYNSIPQAGITFRHKYHSNGAMANLAGIVGKKENNQNGDFGGELYFFSRTNGVAPTKRFSVGTEGVVRGHTGTSFSSAQGAKYSNTYSTAGWGANIFQDVIPNATLVNGRTYLITFYWSHAGSGAPYILSGNFLFRPNYPNSSGTSGPTYRPFQTAHTTHGTSRYFEFAPFAGGYTSSQGIRVQPVGWSIPNNSTAGNFIIYAAEIAWNGS